MNRFSRYRTLGLLTLLLILSSCALSGRRYGVVTDEEGNPIEGVEVTFAQMGMIPRPADGAWTELWTTTRVTNASGEYPLPFWVAVEPAPNEPDNYVIPYHSSSIRRKVKKEGYDFSPTSDHRYSNTIDVILKKIPPKVVEPMKIYIKSITSPTYSGKSHTE